MKSIKRLKLYFVRHGYTLFNKTTQVQGSCDSPLTDIGKQQAVLTGKALKDITFSGIYCADLGRHRKTAQYILSQNLQTHPEIIEHDGFREWGFGGYEGRPDAEMWTPLFEKHGLRYDAQFTDFYRLKDILDDRGICEEIAYNDPMGLAEHYDGILSRARAALDRILNDAEGSANNNVLIVTSYNIMATIFYMIIADEYRDEIIENCSITTLIYHEGRFSVEKLADAAHLDIGTL